MFRHRNKKSDTQISAGFVIACATAFSTAIGAIVTAIMSLFQ